MTELGKIWCFSKNTPEICCWKSKLILKLHEHRTNKFSILKNCRDSGWKRPFQTYPALLLASSSLFPALKSQGFCSGFETSQRPSLEFLQSFADAPSELGVMGLPQ